MLFWILTWRHVASAILLRYHFALISVVLTVVCAHVLPQTLPLASPPLPLHVPHLLPLPSAPSSQCQVTSDCATNNNLQQSPTTTNNNEQSHNPSYFLLRSPPVHLTPHHTTETQTGTHTPQILQGATVFSSALARVVPQHEDMEVMRQRTRRWSTQENELKPIRRQPWPEDFDLFFCRGAPRAMWLGYVGGPVVIGSQEELTSRIKLSVSFFLASTTCCATISFLEGISSSGRIRQLTWPFFQSPCVIRPNFSNGSFRSPASFQRAQLSFWSRLVVLSDLVLWTKVSCVRYERQFES